MMVNMRFARRYASTLFAIGVLLCLSLLLAACDADTVLAKVAPAEETQRAKAYLEHIRLKQFAQVKPHLDPRVQTLGLDEKLAGVSNGFHAGPPLEIKLVG